MKKIYDQYLVRIFRGLFRHEKWEVGIVNASIEKFLDPNFQPPIQWLSGLSKNEFRADPFGLERNGRLEIYCERFNYFSGRGHLEKLSLCGKGGIVEEEAVFDFSFHSSYPFIFEHSGKKYLVPETQENNSVDLFRLDEKSNRWEKVRTLIENFPGADPTVFFDGKLFWLMVSREDDGKFEKIFVFYSNNIETGEWTPHLKNPVKKDLSSARSAGTPFFYQGSWYRPAQDCSRVYGGGVAINRIVKLTPEDFEEEVAIRIYPPRNSAFPDGLHTLSSAGKVTLVDGKRIVFSFGGFCQFFVRNIKKILKLF